MIFASPRLIARRFEPRDLAAFVAMRNDPDVARYQSWESYSEAEGRRFIEELAGEEPGSAGWFQFALEDKATGAFVGDLGLNLAEGRRQANIGYSIVRACWNRGLATEAVRALANYCFSTFPVHRISASVDPRNEASCRVLEKSGFVKEGHFRQSEWFKGAWADDAIYALLRE
jgi:RimJ/RimL family protein N-acetyltransferase